MEHEFFRERCGKCMYGSGEGDGCGMTQERYRELYDNDTLDRLPCRGRGIEPGITGSIQGTGNTAGAEVVLSGFTDYGQYKAEMDRELTRAAESFVRIGYLLRVAEDTDILKESGYRNVTEFAAAEYSLDKTQVSRFMNINIRFSEGGYSDRLEERYRRFGYAKLALMLNLPDAVNEELPDSLSKTEVQAVADEIKAESAISDIELAIERAEVAPVQPEGQETSLLHRAAAQLCREQQELFSRIWYAQDDPGCMQEILVPQGEAVFMVRIPGMGRIMIVVRDQESSVTVVRTGEKERCSTEGFVLEIQKICHKGATPQEAFLHEFGEGMEKTEDAFVQTSRPAAAVEKKEPKQRRASRVTKARSPEPAAAIREQPAAAVEGTEGAGQEEQLPGQMEVYDYPELIPEEWRRNSHGTDTGRTADGVHQDPVTAGGSGSGEKEAYDVPEPHEIPGTAEDDGCAGDPERTDDRTAEDAAWEEVREAVGEIRGRTVPHWGLERGIGTDQVQKLYRRAIDLAAALEKIMMIRSRKNE